MAAVKSGDKVRIHYTGTLDSGETFDSSAGREPLEFVVGSGMVIPGFDSGVMGMEPGQKKSIHIPCEDAYGPHQPENVLEFDRSRVPANMEPKVGMMIELRSPEGQTLPVRISEIRDNLIILDANHPLAGQALNFQLELVSIEAA